MSNKVYDILKFIAQIVLPALATLIFALTPLWNIPYTEQIIGTISAIDVFLGAILSAASAKHKKDMKEKQDDE